MFKMIGLVLLIVSASFAMAADAKSDAVTADEMRCGKLLSTKLVDFKNSLVENCNLNKPFSTSLSSALNDDVYFYCCHKK